jgi:subtilisin-like proprotein convertase family protein
MVLGTNIRDMLGNPLNQNGNGVNGEATIDRATATGVLQATTTQTFSALSLPVPISDNTTTTAIINVTQAIDITHLSAKINIAHSRVSDLLIQLVGPNGQVVTLFNHRGGIGANLRNTVFDDAAGIPIGSVVLAHAPFAGKYRPETPLAGFNGMLSTGIWTLKVTDTKAHHVGKLLGFSLTITGTT